MDWRVKAVFVGAVFILGILYLAGLDVEKELKTAVSFLITVLGANEVKKEYNEWKLRKKAR